MKEVEVSEDLDSNIQVAGPIPLAAWLIIVTELCERFAYYGASMLFQRYMLQRLLLGKSKATAISRGFNFFSYMTAIFGAAVADKWLGKFKTVLLFAIIYTLGLVLLTVSAIDSLRETVALPGFLVSIFCLISWGTGGIKSNVSAFAAEQLPIEDYPHPKKVGYTVNHAVTVERLFRYFYMAINIGGLLGQGITPAVSSYAWDIAYMIPAIAFVVGIIVFALGRNKYYDRPPNGNVLGKCIRCITYAFRHRHERPEGTHWVQSALPRNGETFEWDAKFVKDLERTYHACKVFCIYPLYWALYNNMTDNFVNMGINMTRPNWLKPEMLSFVNSLVIVIFIPILDTFIFPMLRKAGFRLGPVNRIIIGFCIVTFCFVYVTVLQHFLYKSGPYYNFTGKDPNGNHVDVPTDISLMINELTIWAQLPAYILIGISEIFSSATGLEFAFRSAAPELKSVVMSLFLCTNAFGSLIGMILAIWSSDPNFVYLYAAQAVAMAIMTVLFAWRFARLDNMV
ncbi:peptide transporter PTR2-A [Gamsiella multidivaricata]|uniref:peptide transporter PTR2-A n=1 Tax=Gamsiella multidivaricata TaxID=101098 RepID=UPI00221FF044|nr:peptide transporter PTR2-A [Gamsiella multidivaricata]KAI7825280.1 peptide transporter PTR2-A [Gamsiella multidivaricata]